MADMTEEKSEREQWGKRKTLEIQMSLQNKRSSVEWRQKDSTI